MKNPDKNKYSRRDFFDKAAKGGAGLLFTPFVKKVLGKNSVKPLAVSRVVVVRDDNALFSETNSASAINQDVVQVMMNEGIKSLTGNNDVGEAWKSLFPTLTQSTVIGIKVNCLFASMPTHPKITNTVVAGLMNMVVEGNPFLANNIIVWDQSDGDLKKVGYTINTMSEGARCFGTNGKFDSTYYNIDDGGRQKLSKILVEQCSYIINLCALKNHWISGVSLSMKNHFGSAYRPDLLHGSNYCKTTIPSLNSIQVIRDKQVVAICDGIYGVHYGGPDHTPTFYPKSLIFSKDPVAMDYTGAKMLEANGCTTAGLTGMGQHIATAAQAPYNLGVCDPNQIVQIDIENPSASMKVENSGSRQTAPNDFRLLPNYPNPFNSQTILFYRLDKKCRIKLDIYNTRGVRIRTLLDGTKNRGEYRVVWDGTTLDGKSAPSGIYIARLQTNHGQHSIRMELIR